MRGRGLGDAGWDEGYKGEQADEDAQGKRVRVCAALHKVSIEDGRGWFPLIA